MSVNPGFGGQKFLLPRSIDPASRPRQKMGLDYRIEVDGGIAHDTVASVVKAGDMLVAGSAIFAPRGMKTAENAREFLRIAHTAADITV